MTKPTPREAVYESLKSLDVAEFSDDSNLDDIGVDSLDRVEIAMLVETELSARLDDRELDAAVTVADLIAIAEKVSQHELA